VTGVVDRSPSTTPEVLGAGPANGLAPALVRRVLVVAAYPAVRAGLVALLAQDRSIQPVEPVQIGRRGQGWTLVERFGDEPAFDAIVVDLAGVVDQGVEELVEQLPGVPLVLLGGGPGGDGRGFGEGPIAYLGPDADGPVLVAAVHAVAAGLTVIDPAVATAAGIHTHAPGQDRIETVAVGAEPLTAREREVLRLVADGLPNKTIARQLGISEHTAKFHVGSLLAKLGASSRTEAVTLATRRGLLAI
jgi:DNA-binding NarL/FixJ family response regulator